MNPIASVDQANMIADHDVTVSSGRRSKAGVQVTRHGPDGSSHIRRENKSFPDIWLPFSVPIPTLILPKSIGMIPVPIARSLTIAIIEPIMIVMIPILMVPILRALVAIILIMMVPIVLILRLSQRYAKKQSDKQCCTASEPASNIHETLPVMVQRIKDKFKAETKS